MGPPQAAFLSAPRSPLILIGHCATTPQNPLHLCSRRSSHTTRRPLSSGRPPLTPHMVHSTPLAPSQPQPRGEESREDLQPQTPSLASSDPLSFEKISLPGVAPSGLVRNSPSAHPSPSSEDPALLNEGPIAAGKSSAAWLSCAHCEASNGDMPAARLSFANAVQAAAPADGRAWLAWARCEARFADTISMENVLRKATEALPNDSYLWNFWAQQTLKSRRGSHPGRVDAENSARTILRQGMELCPDSAILRTELAKLEAKAHNYNEARRLFAEAAVVDPGDSYVWMDWANLEIRTGRRGAARAVFADGVNRVSNKNATVLLTAYAKFEAGENCPRSARDLFQKAAESYPKDKFIWQTWACFEEDQGNVDRARELFERGVVVTGGEISSLWQAWGMLEQRTGHFDIARQLFERGTRASPQDSATWAAWGRLEAKTGNVIEARRLFEHAAGQLGSSSPGGPIFLSWAQLEADTGHIDFACEILRRAIDRRCENRADAVRLMHTLAGLDWKAGRRTAAHESYERALKINQRDPMTAHAFARLKVEMEDYVGARSLLRKASRHSPNDSFIFSALAVIEWRHFADDGGLERARELFAKGARANPRDVRLVREWANFEADHGDHDLANRLRSIPRRWEKYTVQN